MQNDVLCRLKQDKHLHQPPVKNDWYEGLFVPVVPKANAYLLFRINIIELYQEKAQTIKRDYVGIE